MGIFVHCRAAAVPRHHLPCWIEWDKVILAPRQAVIDLQSGQLAARSGLGPDPWRLFATVGSHATCAQLLEIEIEIVSVERVVV